MSGELFTSEQRVVELANLVVTTTRTQELVAQRRQTLLEHCVGSCLRAQRQQALLEIALVAEVANHHVHLADNELE